MREKLLPCPFCGSEDITSDHDSYQNWYVICKECGAEMRDLAPDLVHQHWNRRKQDVASERYKTALIKIRDDHYPPSDLEIRDCKQPEMIWQSVARRALEVAP